MSIRPLKKLTSTRPKTYRRISESNPMESNKLETPRPSGLDVCLCTSAPSDLYKQDYHQKPEWQVAVPWPEDPWLPVYYVPIHYSFVLNGCLCARPASADLAGLGAGLEPLGKLAFERRPKRTSEGSVDMTPQEYFVNGGLKGNNLQK